MRLQSIEEVKNLRDSVAEVYVTTVLSDVRLGSVIGEIPCWLSSNLMHFFLYAPVNIKCGLII
jgi:hypothetical protein